MGFLFNTHATREILKHVNNTFNRDGLRRILQDQAAGTNWNALFQSMGTPGVSTYSSVCRPLEIDFDIGSASPSLLSKRWKKWLHYIDGNMDYLGSGKFASAVIGAALAKAVPSAGASMYTQVEFFAVPSTNPGAGNSVGVQTKDFIDSYGETSLIITIYTQTVDGLL
jgi:hypothetical protein